MNEEVRPPQQERSRQLLARMLRATGEILCEEGLDGATIPRIAARAAIAPASVYRRFRDKDALLRATFLRVLDIGDEAAPKLLGPAVFAELTVEEGAARIVGLLFMQYRGAPKLLKAFVRFHESQSDPGFRHAARERLTRNFTHMTRALLATKELAGKPEAEPAVALGLLAVTNAIETFVLEPDSLWSVLQPTTDEQVQTELARMLAGYVRTPRLGPA